jgi:hypothetical protein
LLEPETIQTALESKLRAIPALVTLMASSADIAAYVDEWPTKSNLTEAITQQRVGSILIAHLETSPGQLNRMETWRHRFALYIKPKGKMSAIWKQLVDGVPTNGDGLSMLRTESLNSKLHSMNVPSCVRRFQSISDTTILDYFEVSYTFDEKGA